MAKEKTNSLKEIYQQMLDVSGSMKARFKTAVLLLSLSAIVQGIAYSCFYPVFNSLEHKDYSNLWLYFGIAVGLIVLSAVFRWIGQNYDYKGYSTIAQYELRTKQGEKLREFPLEMLSKRRSGEWSAVIGGNVEEVTTYSLTVLSILLYALVVPITVGVLTFFFDWRIGLAILIVFPTIIPLYRWRKPYFDRGMRYLNDVHTELSAESIEYIQGLAVLKLSNSTGDKVNSINQVIQKVEDVQTIGHKKGTTPNLIMTSAMELGLLIVLSIGIVLILGGSGSTMILAALMVIVLRFSELISNFVAMTMFLSMFETAYTHIKKMMGVQPLLFTDKVKELRSHEIAFENVSFKYEGSKEWILEHINLQIPEKSIVALVGPSGSGKTSLTKLIMRYADCQEGRITIGGADIRDMNQKMLLGMISTVFQDVYLFNDTITNNIRMAKETADDEEIIAVAKRAQCHDFISALPDGYNTKLGDAGGTLSGGERQRIAIARALLKDSPIVILDEPTAALDASSELAAQKAIDELVKEKIVIVIAHRLSTIIGANKIVVIDEGKIVEEGTHKELIAQKGRYFNLWEAQRYIDEGVE